MSRIVFTDILFNEVVNEPDAEEPPKNGYCDHCDKPATSVSTNLKTKQIVQRFCDDHAPVWYV